MNQHKLNQSSQLIKIFEKAKKEDNEHFLVAFTQAHQKARAFLNNTDINTRVRNFLTHRMIAIKKQMYFKALYPMVEYVEVFGTTDKIGETFTSIIPTLCSSECLKECTVFANNQQPCS